MNKKYSIFTGTSNLSKFIPRTARTPKPKKKKSITVKLLELSHTNFESPTLTLCMIGLVESNVVICTYIM